MIPAADVRALMRSSIAVINPSLCEGWSTTVEEAKSLQVPLVLSDLAVHREQAAGSAEFFDPHSAADAARALTAALERFRPWPRGAARPRTLIASGVLPRSPRSSALRSSLQSRGSGANHDRWMV